MPCAPEARYSNKVAHGEQSTATVLTADQPGLLFDYYGFPAESYHYDYPCPGSPEVAERVIEHLRAAGIGCEPDAQRGLDHGAFVPLMLMYPQAQVPCL